MTSADQINRPWLYAGVGTITGATLILELTLTRIFSVVMYYHFAFLAISLALFGLGFAGTWLYLRPRLGERARFAGLLHRASLYTAAGTVIALLVVLHARVGLKFEAGNLWTLTLVYLACAVPFFFAGLCVSVSVKRMRADMGRLYFFDLLGAGLGCLLLIPLLDGLGGPGTVLFSGLLCLLANLLFSAAEPPARPLLRRLPPAVLAAGMLVLIVLEAGGDPPFRVPSVKGTNEKNVVFSEWNSFSRVTVEKTRSDHYWLKMDSSAATRIFSGAIAAEGFEPSRRFSETRVASLVYNLRRPGTALIIGPGGGADVIAALYFGITDVLGVELNPIIVRDVMLGEFREFSGGLYERPDVTIVADEGRSFIRGSGRRFSSIQATLVDTWAATAAGAFTLSENNLYTQQAFTDYVRHLTDDGVLTMTRWTHHDEFLRLLVLCKAALEDELHAADPARHLYVAADNRMATFLLKKTPFTPAELRTLDAAVRRDKLKRFYSPAGKERNVKARNVYARLIRNPQWRSWVAAHRRDLSPPQDSRPFFFYTVKPGDILGVFARPGRLTKDNLGLLLLLLLIAVVLALVLLFLLLPLFLLRRDVLREARRAKLRFLLYFVALGAGFITVEIAAMQKFVLFLGHPVYALVVVLFSLLVFSGLGSFLVRDVAPRRIGQVATRNLGLLAGLLLFDLLAAFPLFYAFAGWPLPARALLAVAYMAPLGLLMGSFLPLGIRAAGQRFGELVPWAWGMNGAASVLGSVLCIALAMNLGFDLTLVVGLGFYLLGFLAWRPGRGRP